MYFVKFTELARSGSQRAFSIKIQLQFINVPTNSNKSDLHSRNKSIALFCLFKELSLFYTDSIYALSCFVFESTSQCVCTGYSLNSDYV